MSYCRWSSDDYQCDVYVWHDVSDTWQTAVAGGRRELLGEPPPIPKQGDISGWGVDPCRRRADSSNRRH